MDHRLQRIAGLASLVLGVSLVCHAALAATQAGAAAVEVQPSPGRFLFWTPAEQRFGYRNMERIFPTHVVSRGTAAVSELPRVKDEPAVNFVDNGRSVAKSITSTLPGWPVMRCGRWMPEAASCPAAV